MNNQSEPLSKDERALAERLARLGPHGEPSPGLDARILAAAHAAASTPAQARRPTRRWPVALGIAASLTLAVGIAWQLRPVQEAATYDEAASATAAQARMPVSSAESAADTIAANPQTAVAAPQPETGSGPERASAVESRRERANVRSAPRAFIPAPPPPPPQEPVVFDEAAAPAEPAMPAPSPVVSGVQAPPPAASAAKTTSAENRDQAVQRDSANAAAGAAAASRQDAFAEDAAAEDVPPATADSPAVRDAWLRRIRELASSGNTEDARTSLREFVRRYPDHPLPDDLRALLE